MAQTVTIAGQQFKKRNIVGVWIGLPLITLGIYFFVWIYKVNYEARRSVLAFIPGFLLIVPPYIAVYRLGKRIQRMEEAAQMQSRAEPVLGLILAFLYGAYLLYYQSHLNGIWDRYLQVPVTPPQPLAPPPPITAAPQLPPPQNAPPPPPIG
ncbi:MAG: DUF4234 domain-containing protein [Chloroflexi bacterium]|nr:MAG: DUF4234 domain-containing protein [Chloroflexota bacterium]